MLTFANTIPSCSLLYGQDTQKRLFLSLIVHTKRLKAVLCPDSLREPSKMSTTITLTLLVIFLVATQIRMTVVCVCKLSLLTYFCRKLRTGPHEMSPRYKFLVQVVLMQNNGQGIG